jgi:hypothetical protein
MQKPEVVLPKILALTKKKFTIEHSVKGIIYPKITTFHPAVPLTKNHKFLFKNLPY